MDLGPDLPHSLTRRGAADRALATEVKTREELDSISVTFDPWALPCA
jgi:hypothetical protein